MSRGAESLRFLFFAFVGIALGYVLNLLAGLSGQRAAVWLALIGRLVLFVLVVAVLARSFGPAAGLAVLVTAVLTRWILVRKRLSAVR